MFKYYFALALRSLRRNVVLTVLMIAAVGVGIGASMTILTVFRAMSADPVPDRSGQLFVPQINTFGPAEKMGGPVEALDWQDQLSYLDAKALMDAHVAAHQAAMYATGMALMPENAELQPFIVQSRATYADFFGMFGLKFLYGGPWAAADDAARANVVVIARDLNDKVFGGANSVGRTVNLDNHVFRVVGVVDRWRPLPRFYDLTNDRYGKSEELFLPFTRAIDAHMNNWGNTNCNEDPGSGWEQRQRSECVWIQFWAELPTSADVARYRDFLKNYAAEQHSAGRFKFTPLTALRDVRDWLTYEHVVVDEARILVLVSFSFLFVCLLNAMGLMLAKFMGRSADISVRRALGATRAAIFGQCLTEAAVIGVAGGVLGLALTVVGTFGLRQLLSEDIAALTHLDAVDVALAVALAIAATIVAGLYPTWRATRLQPAWQLKAQ